MVLNAVLMMVGVARPSFCMSNPTAVGRPSAQPSAGLWQLAQLIEPFFERRGSQNSISPSWMRDEFGRLCAGAGAASGRNQGSLPLAKAALTRMKSESRVSGVQIRRINDLEGMRAQLRTGVIPCPLNRPRCTALERYIGRFTGV
jgi:hypothetical protein